MNRQAKKKVESLLTAYPLKKALIVEKHREYGSPRAVQTDRDNIRSGPGDPTGRAVQALEDDEAYQDALRVVRVVEDTLPHLTEIERDIIHLEFFSTKDRTKEGYMMELCVSRRTYYKHRNRAMAKFSDRAGLAG